MSVAREGWPPTLILLGLGVGVLCFRLYVPGVILVCLGLFTAFFFRDPERIIPRDPRLVLSPADGKVIVVGPAPAGNPLGPDAWQISIFLSIFDVHVNRAPVAGRVTRVEYNRGEFLPAFDDKASLRNEQNCVTIEEGTTRVAFKQIAGLIARRIVFRKRPGDTVKAGERVGMIKFGSRVDVFLGKETAIRVKMGDRVRGGTSVLGEWP